jgi:hypothetical protein
MFIEVFMLHLLGKALGSVVDAMAADPQATNKGLAISRDAEGVVTVKIVQSPKS